MIANVILHLDGAFGIGKTTVARILVGRLPSAVLYSSRRKSNAADRDVNQIAGRIVQMLTA